MPLYWVSRSDVERFFRLRNPTGKVTEEQERRISGVCFESAKFSSSSLKQVLGGDEAVEEFQQAQEARARELEESPITKEELAYIMRKGSFS